MVAFPADFYGFPDVPLHIHLGMRFDRDRPDGPATVTIPADPAFAPGGRQSPAAVYTLGEVAAGIAVCDALVLHATEVETAMIPLVLTQETRFAPGAPATGTIRSATEFVGDSGEAVERLKSARKIKAQTVARVHGEDGTLAGRLDVLFYVRLMRRERLEAMAATLMPRMAEGREAAARGATA